MKLEALTLESIPEDKPYELTTEEPSLADLLCNPPPYYQRLVKKMEEEKQLKVTYPQEGIFSGRMYSKLPICAMIGGISLVFVYSIIKYTNVVKPLFQECIIEAAIDPLFRECIIEISVVASVATIIALASHNICNKNKMD